MKVCLSGVLSERVREKWEASQLAHFQYGEGCSKRLAWKVKSDQVRSLIKEISCEGSDVVLRDSSGIASDFYEYSGKEYKEDLVVTERDVMTWLVDMEPLSEEDKGALNKEISVEELEEAIMGW